MDKSCIILKDITAQYSGLNSVVRYSVVNVSVYHSIWASDKPIVDSVYQ